MIVSIRSRLMVAALVFALAWALGVVVHRLAHASLAIVFQAIGSAALSYLVWEYHRAWRLRPSNAGSTASLGLRAWPGISVDGLMVRPEYITAALAFFACVLGMILYFEASSRTPLPAPGSPPPSLRPESKPLQ
jgi:threonine/homoserine/homoserine lactone efflux protein